MRLLAVILAVMLSTTICLAESDSIDSTNGLTQIVPTDARVEKLAGNMQFIEGPVWSKDGGFLLFSDIPASEIKKWDASSGVSTFRKQTNHTNGNTRDEQGRLISCEHESRRVTRTEKDGSITVLVDS